MDLTTLDSCLFRDKEGGVWKVTRVISEPSVMLENVETGFDDTVSIKELPTKGFTMLTPVPWQPENTTPATEDDAAQGTSTKSADNPSTSTIEEQCAVCRLPVSDPKHLNGRGQPRNYGADCPDEQKPTEPTSDNITP